MSHVDLGEDREYAAGGHRAAAWWGQGAERKGTVLREAGHACAGCVCPCGHSKDSAPALSEMEAMGGGVA